MKNNFLENLNCMVDLHLHLDGAISLSSAGNLAKLQNIQIPESDEELLRLIRVDESCKNLSDFLGKFDFPCSLLQTEKGIRQAVINLLNELKEQGVMYSEIRFAPQKLTDKGITQEDAVLSAVEGLNNSPIPANLILCCMREKDNRSENLETVRLAEKYLGKGVVALDIAGNEAGFPLENYREIFDTAEKKGIPFTIHAGEASGAESVKVAVSLGADRIGHGVRVAEDENLLKEIAKKQIPLELCPTSNICTRIFEKISDFPLKKLIKSGAIITINTDDPAIENTDIKNEYKILIDNFGIGMDEVKEYLFNAVSVSFADKEMKIKLKEKIENEFEKLAE